MLCQNTCDVPLGMTAMFTRSDVDAPPPHPAAIAATVATLSISFLIGTHLLALLAPAFAPFNS